MVVEGIGIIIRAKAEAAGASTVITDAVEAATNEETEGTSDLGEDVADYIVTRTETAHTLALNVSTKPKDTSQQPPFPTCRAATPQTAIDGVGRK